MHSDLQKLIQRGGMNVAILNGSVKGVGGFMNISAGAKAALVVGTFTAGGVKTAVEDGKLKILKEGKFKKFVAKLPQNAFDAVGFVKSGKPLYYITERAVFQMTPEGLVLIEIAPGIDLQIFRYSILWNLLRSSLKAVQSSCLLRYSRKNGAA